MPRATAPRPPRLYLEEKLDKLLILQQLSRPARPALAVVRSRIVLRCATESCAAHYSGVEVECEQNGPKSLAR